MKGIRLIILAASVIGLAGCSGALDREDYIAWVRDYDNNLHVKKEHGDFVFDLQYAPAAYVWLQRYGGMTVTQQEYETQKKEIGQMQYYTLTISVKDNTRDFIDYKVVDLPQKQRKLYYFSYSFQNDIRLEESGELLPCVLFHFEKPADLRNSRTFVLGFENPHDEVTEARLVISSFQFGSLPFKIKISKEHIPLLAL